MIFMSTWRKLGDIGPRHLSRFRFFRLRTAEATSTATTMATTPMTAPILHSEAALLPRCASSSSSSMGACVGSATSTAKWVAAGACHATASTDLVTAVKSAGWFRTTIWGAVSLDDAVDENVLSPAPVACDAAGDEVYVYVLDTDCCTSPKEAAAAAFRAAACRCRSIAACFS